MQCLSFAQCCDYINHKSHISMKRITSECAFGDDSTVVLSTAEMTYAEIEIEAVLVRSGERLAVQTRVQTGKSLARPRIDTVSGP
jgi:hypothetical protein